MKIYLLSDLEGAAGVNRWRQTRERETPEKRAAMALLTGEVNAAIEGVLDAEPGAEIVVLDGHGSGGLVFEAIHPKAQVIMRGDFSARNFGFDPSFDALMFVGQHAMAGTPEAPLCHTFSSQTIESYHLNGQAIGEFGCYAARFGEMNVPTIFLSGDDKACLEAQALVPDLIAVATKRGMGIELALHLSAAEARRQIRAGAAAAIRKIGKIAPLRFTPPFELEIRLREGADPAPYAARFEPIAPRTFRRRAQTLAEILA